MLVESEHAVLHVEQLLRDEVKELLCHAASVDGLNDVEQSADDDDTFVFWRHLFVDEFDFQRLLQIVWLQTNDLVLTSSTKPQTRSSERHTHTLT